MKLYTLFIDISHLARVKGAYNITARLVVEADNAKTARAIARTFGHKVLSVQSD